MQIIASAHSVDEIESLFSHYDLAQNMKPAFATANVIAIMTDSESDIEPLSDPLSAPDSEPGEECDSEPDSEVEDASLAPLEPRDNVPFSLS